MADELRQDSGIDVQEVDGAKSEFTVLVDGREVIRKEGDDLPLIEKVVAAVRRTGQSASPAGV